MNNRQLRVLLVDDEPSLREPLAKYLRRTYDYHVDTADSSEDALARVTEAQDQYDVALIDYFLTLAPGHEPEPLGIQLMVEIKACSPHTEFILYNGPLCQDQTSTKIRTQGT